MLTIRTKVFDKGSFLYKVDDFMYKLCHPLKFNWVSKIYDKMTSYRDASYIRSVYLTSFDISDEHHIDINKASEVEKVKTGGTEKFPSYRYEFTCHGKTYVAIDSNNKHNVFMSGDREYVYLKEIDKWFDVHKQMSNDKYKASYWKGSYQLKHIILNRTGYIKYRIYEFLTIKLINRWLNPYRFMHTLDSIYLCLKYPFLYTRNRFTGLHYTWWKLYEYTNKLKQEGRIGLTGIFTKENIEADFSVYPLVYKERNDYCVKTHDNVVLKVCSYDKSYTNYPVRINGRFHIYDVKSSNWYDIHKDTLKYNIEEEIDKVHFFLVNIDDNKLRWAKFLRWIHDNVIGLFHFIPTSSELDAMPEGWRRNFGLKMCDELKAELKKTGYMKDFRIMQIKEKFGGLRFYVAAAPRSVYKIIDKYEDMSYKICINCGKPAEYITSGWICPYCGDCISEESKLTAQKISD